MSWRWSKLKNEKTARYTELCMIVGAGWLYLSCQEPGLLAMVIGNSEAGPGGGKCRWLGEELRGPSLLLFLPGHGTGNDNC